MSDELMTAEEWLKKRERYLVLRGTPVRSHAEAAEWQFISMDIGSYVFTYADRFAREVVELRRQLREAEDAILIFNAIWHEEPMLADDVALAMAHVEAIRARREKERDDA